MASRRRQVLIQSRKGTRKAPFTVPESATAVDVSLRLREAGWTPYKISLDRERGCWIAVVIDWQHAA
ncbi:MAG TPA: hypothetical protein VFP60_06075 [Pseudolabrys sp.]|nr:hypothetical protein [Pseudolabrys sp.]